MSKPSAWRSILASRRIAISAALGFAGGLPLMLTGQIMTLWLTEAKIDMKTVGLFASVGLPYTLKFLWAPLLDRYALPFLGRRRGWMLVTQIGLVMAITSMAITDPRDAFQVALLAVVIAALSATQDIAIDAWRADLFDADERAAASAAYVLGYRIALLVVGTLGLIVADHFGYRALFAGVAVLMAACVVATKLAEEPTRSARQPQSILQALGMPFGEFFKRLGWLAAVALLFAATYKFGDQMVDTFLSAFWFKPEAEGGLGMTKSQIAMFNKVAGFAGVTVGAALAAILTPRLGTRRALLAFGVTQAATNLLYISLAVTGKSYVLIGTSIFVDNVANMMGTAAFMAVFAAMCNTEVSATQYAMLTSLSSVGKRVFSWVGGIIIEDHGWATFFGATAVMAIPGLLLVFVLPRALLEPPRPRA